MKGIPTKEWGKFEYYSHPIYTNLEACKEGVIKYKKEKVATYTRNGSGYRTIRFMIDKKWKRLQWSNIVFECYLRLYKDSEDSQDKTLARNNTSGISGIYQHDNGLWVTQYRPIGFGRIQNFRMEEDAFRHRFQLEMQDISFPPKPLGYLPEHVGKRKKQQRKVQKIKQRYLDFAFGKL